MRHALAVLTRSQLARRLAVLATTAVLAGFAASSASAATMNCTQPGFCTWGYNYMGVSVNTYLTGNWNYWYDQYVDKNSGGEIGHGFNTAAHCYEYMTGTSTWYGHPSDTGNGCGGYLQPFAQWVQGNTSYLYMDDYT